jgi:hypothetical protein
MRQGSVKILRDLCLIARLRRPLLPQYHWPGNVRELENIVERLLVYAAEAGQLQAAVMASMAPELFSVRQAPLPGESAKLDIADALAAANGSLGQPGAGGDVIGHQPHHLVAADQEWGGRQRPAQRGRLGISLQAALDKGCRPDCKAIWMRLAGQLIGTPLG